VKSARATTSGVIVSALIGAWNRNSNGYVRASPTGPCTLEITSTVTGPATPRAGKIRGARDPVSMFSVFSTSHTSSSNGLRRTAEIVAPAQPWAPGETCRRGGRCVTPCSQPAVRQTWHAIKGILASPPRAPLGGFMRAPQA
jgi:hypothetical protein